MRPDGTFGSVREALLTQVHRAADGRRRDTPRGGEDRRAQGSARDRYDISYDITVDDNWKENRASRRK